MRVTFWGTRGSIAKPGPTTVRYGGNTSCVEVRSAAGTLIVLDCGTGAHGLGQALLAAGPPSLRGHLLITHTHWDHIQGIPFFGPLFARDNEWDIYAPRGLGQHVKETLAGQMQYTYFPVRLEQLGATIGYHELVEGTFAVDDIRVTAQYLNHPALALGYRLEADGVAVVYATDHEPHARPGAPAAAGGIENPQDRRHARFLAGADLLIHDAQYTAADFPAKLGWGHSPVEYVVDVAAGAGVRRLALFHHDPLRDDAAVEAIVTEARRRAAGHGSAVEIHAAAEGAVFELTGRGEMERERPARDALALSDAPHAAFDRTVVAAVTSARTAALLAEAVLPDGIRLLPAADGEAALELTRRERPSLLILDRALRARDPLDVCRTLRAETEPQLRDVPVVLVAAVEDPDAVARAAAAGVTDWLIEPFTSEYARTKVRAWLLRAQCRWVRAPLPDDERVRIRALRRLGVLDTTPEERFDRITRLAQRLFDVPVVLVSLVDTDRQWFKSCQGLSVRETPREVAFCAHTILSPEVLVVPDALEDPRFADSPLVTGPPHIRFYAGHPLSAPNGGRVGTLCIIDTRPRQLGASDLAALRDLAALVEQELARRARR